MNKVKHIGNKFHLLDSVLIRDNETRWIKRFKDGDISVYYVESIGTFQVVINTGVFPLIFGVNPNISNNGLRGLINNFTY